MYFEDRPKTRKEDLYDRDEELGQFLKALSYTGLVVVTGLRRAGKTSFVNVALKESGYPHAMLDFRGLPYNPSRAEIVQRLQASFSNIDRKWYTSLTESLEHLRGVSILGNEINFAWGKTGLDMVELFSRIDKWARSKKTRFLMALDEVQIVRGDKWLPSFIAHVFDTYRNITLILTGSEIGVLFDFLGFDQPKSPLYGRHYSQIQMDSFPEDKAKQFLTKGFKQINLTVASDTINYAVKKLDGVAGWLTLLGVRSQDRGKCTKETVDTVVSEAGKLAREEAAKLAAKSTRYAVILNFLAEKGEAKWSLLKTMLETKETRTITNTAASNLLKTLQDTGHITNTNGKYTIADPLLTEGLKQQPLPE